MFQVEEQCSAVLSEVGDDVVGAHVGPVSTFRSLGENVDTGLRDTKGSSHRSKQSDVPDQWKGNLRTYSGILLKRPVGILPYQVRTGAAAQEVHNVGIEIGPGGVLQVTIHDANPRLSFKQQEKPNYDTL